jgi:hypothetical protein
MGTSIDTNNTLNKIQHLFMKIKFNKLRIKGNYINTTKVMNEKPTTSYTEWLNTFSL